MRDDSLCPAVKSRWNRFVERRDLGDTHYCSFFLDFACDKGEARREGLGFDGRSREEVRAASFFWRWSQREQRVSGSMISRSDDRVSPSGTLRINRRGWPAAVTRKAESRCYANWNGKNTKGASALPNFRS